MASVGKRADGRAGWTVRWRDESGRQRKRSFPRKVDADRYAAEVEHTLNAGTYIDPAAGRITFREYAEHWRTTQPHRPNTATRIRSQLTRQIYPVLGSRPLASIRHSDLQAFVSGLTCAPSTVRPIWLNVRAILGAATRDRLIAIDPCTGVKLPELARADVIPLDVEQIHAITDAMPERYRALVMLCAGAGLRQGEAFGLQVRDCDWLRRTVRVARQVQSVTGEGATVCPPKNRSSARTIPVGSTVTDALALHLRGYPASGEQFIFRTPDGGPLTRHAVDRPWRRACVAAGVPDATMHDLRHFYASVLIRAGRSVKTVSERLGHSSAVTTLGVYAHLWPADDDLDRRAVDDMFQDHAPRVRPAKGSSA